MTNLIFGNLIHGLYNVTGGFDDVDRFIFSAVLSNTINNSSLKPEVFGKTIVYDFHLPGSYVVIVSKDNRLKMVRVTKEGEVREL